MVNTIRTRRNSSGSSPRSADIGEIDTKAPFQSVRAAVSLFGEPSTPKAKPVFFKKSKSRTEGALEKESQSQLALEELNRLKEQLRGAESTKEETNAEMNKAKITLEELQSKLETVNESKKSILESTESLKSKAKDLEESKSNKIRLAGDPDATDSQDEEYKIVITELDATKQELSSLRSDFNVAFESKIAAFKNSDEAQLAASAHRYRLSELSEQIRTMQEMLSENSDSSTQAVAKQDLEDKLDVLKKQHEVLLSDNLEAKLSETNAEIESLREKVEKTRSDFLESGTSAHDELETAKKKLTHIEQEKVTLQISSDSLKQELERVSKEIYQHKSKQEETSESVNELHDEIDDKKTQLESETSLENQEAQDTKRRTDELKMEAKTSKDMAIDKENRLSTLLKEIEEEKTANKAKVDVQATSSDDSKIKLSKAEYKSLIERANESEKSAKVKVDATMAQVEALIASQKETAKKIEAGLKEIEALKTAEDEALKSAEMAKEETNALEAELQKRHHQEQIN